MACAAVGVRGASPAEAAMDSSLDGMRRSRSAPQLRCSLPVPRASAAPPNLKTSRSVSLLPLSSLIANSIRSLIFESEEEPPAGGHLGLVDLDDAEHGMGPEQRIKQGKKANWVSRVLELRRQWRDRQTKGGEGDDDEEEVNKGLAPAEDDGEDFLCEASYDDESSAAEEESAKWDRESFERLLGRVSWSDAKLFAQLAYLCNMAYEIPEIKVEDLRQHYGLQLVTSSLEKKAEAAKFDRDSTQPAEAGRETEAEAQPRRLARQSVAYEIAAAAASYVHSRAKGLLSFAGGELPTHQATSNGRTRMSPNRKCDPERAAYVAASTMTTVVAAEETVRLEAAKDLRSLQSSPCEWFVCDDPGTYTRCFVIQGSESLASWQANLFFEPTKFEDKEALIHRGIYEAAKGIYEQLMPEIQEHIQRYGNQARLRFTGHSLGGSLAVILSLMLLARGEVHRSALLRVVTFGAPAVFCGGLRVLEQLGLKEDFVRAVMMHRDIVPRAFSCNYPNHVAHLLKRLNGSFRMHPCLNNEKMLYSPLGQTYILQPHDKSSPFHHLLPPEAALYFLDGNNSPAKAVTASALRAFLNSPHPLETLSDPKAYGSEGTILRDHECSNYTKAINDLVKQHSRSVVRRMRKQRLHQWWPVLASPVANGLQARQSWGQYHHLEQPPVLTNEVLTEA